MSSCDAKGMGDLNEAALGACTTGFMDIAVEPLALALGGMEMERDEMDPMLRLFESKLAGLSWTGTETACPAPSVNAP